ncbi:MAG TPA: class I SAM-dependent methyltransferase [Pirellulaceae bacterium]|nr:class I SAM-dependent methyltransferase [Pirellulaceae bacterium]
MTNHSDQHKIWQHFQNASPESFAAAHPRLEFLIGQIAQRTSGRQPAVLNIGIGDGFFERRAKARGWKVHSLDPDEQAVERLKGEGISAQVGTIEHILHESESLDFIVASEVLEHLTEDQRAAGLAEIARVLRPGGWFLGSVPHAENLAEQHAVCPHCGQVFHRWRHQASFTLASVRQMLAGPFVVEKLKRTAFVDLWSRGPLGFVKGSLRVLLAKLGQPIAVPTIWWVARKE